MYGFPPPTTSAILNGSLTLCTHKRKTFYPKLSFNSKYLPTLNFGTRERVPIPGKSLWVLSAREALKSLLVVKEIVIIAITTYSFSCLVSTLYKCALLLECPYFLTPLTSFNPLNSFSCKYLYAVQ